MSMLAEDFLLAMQKLVLGNSLNTTYKLALILAVTNKAGEIEFVNQPDATHFTISYSEIAREFLRIYWPQARRYERSEENSVESTVLYQSTNPGNAVVITLIRDFQQANATGDLENLTFLQAQRLPGFETLLQECLTRVVKKNPLHYIQGHEFLFEKDDAVDMIRLERNTAVFLCRFQPIIQELIFSRWEKLLRSIKKNAVFLGESSERSLREFLFFPQRTNEALATVKKVLREAFSPAVAAIAAKTIAWPVPIICFIGPTETNVSRAKSSSAAEIGSRRVRFWFRKWRYSSTSMRPTASTCGFARLTAARPKRNF